jgi:hypothetical protein
MNGWRSGREPYAHAVVQVDPEDDSIRRFIVRHYRFDPERRERRHVVVAAFDNEREFLRCLDATTADISGRKQTGEADTAEHASGVVLEPGDRSKQQTARLIQRAAAHGVAPQDLGDLELPRNVASLSASRPSRLSRLRGWLRWRGLP